MSEIFGDFPAAFEAYQQLGDAEVLRINSIFLNAGRKAKGAIANRPVATLGNTQKMYLGDDVLAAAQKLFDTHFPFHDDDGSKDRTWQKAVFTGIIAGHHVGRSIKGTVSTERLNTGITERLNELSLRSHRDYNFADTLEKDYRQNPYHRWALALLPDKYVNEYCSSAHTLGRDRQLLYKHALGATAAVAFGFVVEKVFIDKQPRQEGYFEAKRTIKQFNEQLAALPEFLAPSDQPPAEA